jgi:hypothetical protein
LAVGLGLLGKGGGTGLVGTGSGLLFTTAGIDPLLLFVDGRAGSGGGLFIGWLLLETEGDTVTAVSLLGKTHLIDSCRSRPLILATLSCLCTDAMLPDECLLYALDCDI